MATPRLPPFPGHPQENHRICLHTRREGDVVVRQLHQVKLRQLGLVPLELQVPKALGGGV